jgi:hypothetical protein
MWAARASGSPRAVSLIVFAMIRSTVVLSPFDIPISSLRPGANIHGIPSVAELGWPPLASYLQFVNLELSDEETAALTQELHEIVENGRYPFSHRIRTLRGILGKIRPEPVREPLRPPKVYVPPRATAARRRRGVHRFAESAMR